MRLPFFHKSPEGPGERYKKVIPEVRANLLSRTLFSWVFPVLKTGHTRPLEIDDVWSMDEARLTKHLGSQLEKEFFSRCPPEARPLHLGGIRPVNLRSGNADKSARRASYASHLDVRQSWSPVSSASVDLPQIERVMSCATVVEESDTRGLIQKAVVEEKVTARGRFTKWRESKGLAKGRPVVGSDGMMYDQSLTWALHNTFRRWFYAAAVFQLAAGLLQATSALVTKELISYLAVAYTFSSASESERTTMSTPKGVGHGIAIAISLASMNEVSSLLSNQFYARAMGAGWMMRAALIDQISKKSLRLSGQARQEMTNGRLTTMVSGDASFLDFACPMAVQIVTEPITILVGMALLLSTLGYSALVGLAVLVGSTPLLTFLFKKLITSRQQQMKLVDARVRLLSEILSSIRSIKLYAYEAYFGERVSEIRSQELAKLRRNLFNRAVVIAIMAFMPILAATLTFVTYGLTGHTLTASRIFSGLQLFNIIAGPLRILPFAFSAVIDGHVAIGRIGKLFTADEVPHNLQIEPRARSAIRMSGDFTFEAPLPTTQVTPKERSEKTELCGDKLEQPITPQEPFALMNLRISVPRGSLVVIVGRIGSGKTALLSALIGDMRATTGQVVFGGNISYFAQQPWIQNSSVRDNIVFGEPVDEVDSARLQTAIESCALEPDLEILSDGLDTEIGEKGINLSGGQRARISLARCVYFDADIVLLDDPLAAVDSHVASHIIDKCILGCLKNKTRVLVTNHLEILPRADYIIIMNDGVVAQQGTYQNLRSSGGLFATLMEEFGAVAAQQKEDLGNQRVVLRELGLPTADIIKKEATKLLQDEERETGSVSWKVYTDYAEAMDSGGWLYIAVVGLVVAQIAQIETTLVLGFWSDQAITGFSQGQYMALYAGLGFAQSFLAFVGSYTIALAGIKASFAMFNRAFKRVLRSPVTFHDITPVGRIISRLSKDIEMTDDSLSFQWYQLLSNALSVVGTVYLVLWSYTYLGIIFIPLAIFYYFFAAYYRASSREVKRINSNTRSFIYSAFGEQLSGIATIRAFKQQRRFQDKLQKAIDAECRTAYLNVILQRWLGVRLDALGNILILGIGIFGVLFRKTVSPTRLGVVLTYTLQATQVLSQLVNFFAQVEQEMNTVERVCNYGKLQMEAPPVLHTDPPPEWPQRGRVVFEDVKLRYRDGLPLVLKGLSFEIRPGEKVGIVGRTGAGKSSLSVALFRMVELAGGRIIIDGVDTNQVGLDTLRTRLSAIPQEALLFAGTIRDNLDPTGVMSDYDLNEALMRCGLKPQCGSSPADFTRFEKFKLDAQVTDDGGNFSAGEKQLIALARAVVKNSKVILLDEATSSVDAQTDAMIQETIRREFTGVTLLSIAHRLQTIAFYDRILVLDFGEIAEYAPPLQLYDTPGSIFRSMCDAAHLTRDHIVRIRANEAVSRPVTPTPTVTTTNRASTYFSAFTSPPVDPGFNMDRLQRDWVRSSQWGYR